MFVNLMLTKETYEEIKSKILHHLSGHLSKDLWYHGVHHTIDVENQAIRIAMGENTDDPEDILLLKVACLYHDAGFLETYFDHEVVGCNLARKELPAFGLNPAEVDIVCGMIMATKIPQKPQTKLEEIICDADLDYLGREDFYPVSQTLFSELKARGYVATENDWNLIQINFFRQHQYFTSTTKKLREEKKQQHLEMIEAMLVKK